jgi:hypothetical protein
MAKDADGNYYYDAGTDNEQFDNVDIVEDDDGKLSIAVSGSEVRMHEVGFLFGAQRAAPGTDELSKSDNEVMLFVSDGSDSNTAAGDLAVARNPDGTVETQTVAAASGFSDK